jgi:transposase
MKIRSKSTIKDASADPMKARLDALPSDVDALRLMVLELSGELTGASLLIEKMKLQIARLKKMQFGASSERAQRDLAQMELALEELETVEAEAAAALPVGDQPGPATAKAKPARRPLPGHLPRETVMHEPVADTSCGCPACGGVLRSLGEDVTEVLEYVPASWKVIAHVRPRLSCRACEAIVQAPATGLLARRLRHGPGLIAHTLVAKYADHLPLYRQSEIHERNGIEIDRSTLADSVGHASKILEPLVDLLIKDVMASPVLHGDDTPVPVLAPGAGRTTTGRLWVYAREERPHGGNRPPAAVYHYSPDRKGEHPRDHLASFTGHLHADGYAGFNDLYLPNRKPGPIHEVACWAHARRKFFEIHAATGSTIAGEAVDRIKALYDIEASVRGQPPDIRRKARQERARQILDNLKTWLDTQLTRIPRGGDLARAIGYATSRWPALTRYLDNGALEIDNNAAERAIRGLALGRKNWLFAGSHTGGQRAAAIYTLIETAKLNTIDPQAWLTDVLDRIDDHPSKRLAELLPWNWKAARSETADKRQAAA